MNITKWLKDEKGAIFKVEWQVIPTTEDDARGYTIEGMKGKWLTIVSTFKEDVGCGILSMNPYTHPALAKYEELSEEEVVAIQEKKRAEEDAACLARSSEAHIRMLENRIEALEKEVARKTKILTAVKHNVIYDGDLELMTALHNFTEESLEDEKAVLDKTKVELQELQSIDGE